MRKIFTTLALAAGLLLPSLANAVNVTSITPTPGSAYTADSGTIVLIPSAAPTTSQSPLLTSVICSYGNGNSISLEDIRKLDTFESATEGFYYFGSKTDYYVNIKVPFDKIVASGASEFTLTINGWAYSSSKVTCDLENTTYDNGVITFSYQVEGGGSSIPSNPTTIEDFTWDEPVTPDAQTIYKLLGETYTSQDGFYIQTNSETDLSSTNFIFMDESCTQAISIDETYINNTGLVYARNTWFNMDIYLKYPQGGIEFTFVQGKYEDNSGPSFTTTPLNWNEKVTVPKGDTYYAFTGKGDIAHIVTSVDEDLTIGGNSFYLFYGTDQTDKIDLNYVQTAEGGVYNTAYALQEGQQYVLFVSTASAKLTIELEEGIYESAPVVLSLNTETSLNPNQVYYYTANEEGVLTIQTQTDASYFDGNNIFFSNVEHTTALTGVTTESNSEGAKFTVNVKEGETIYIYFTYPSTYILATLSFKQEDVVDQPTYMSALPTLYFDNDSSMPALFVYWNEAISTINEETTVKATLITPTTEELEVTMNLTSYWPDAQEGDQVAGNNALMLLMANYIETYGAGDYTIKISSGVVMNDDEELNKAIDDIFNVEALPSLSDVPATLTISGDQIVITWDNEPIEAYNPENDDIQIMPADYSKEGWRLNTENGVTITEDSVVIDITALELEEGVSYVILVPENYVLVGEEGLGNEMIDEPFIAQASGVANLISGSDSNSVYNLNGVRVDSNKLNKGVYIINGKKVLVK